MAHFDTLNLLALSHSDSPQSESNPNNAHSPHYFSDFNHPPIDAVTSLKQVDACTLPAKMLILLSKYAVAIKHHNDTVIQLSSLNVFNQVQRASEKCDDPLVQLLHRQLLIQARAYIQSGEMYTVDQKLLEKALEHIYPATHSPHEISVDKTIRESSYNKASAVAQKSVVGRNAHYQP